MFYPRLHEESPTLQNASPEHLLKVNIFLMWHLSSFLTLQFGQTQQHAQKTVEMIIFTSKYGFSWPCFLLPDLYAALPQV